MRLYQLLFERFNGDGIAMRHWLRVEQYGLGSPHCLIVDDARLQQVVDWLQACRHEACPGITV